MDLNRSLHCCLICLHLLSTVCRTLSDPPPNIVIFLADDLGIGDVGCFGNDTIRTPSIDGIARDGVRLTHHLAAAAVCTPSRAALLTGRLPIRSGMASASLIRAYYFLSSSGGLPQNETTFAELAQLTGYTTALIGKWHLGWSRETYADGLHHPLRQGFDYFYGLTASNTRAVSEESFVTLALPWLPSFLWTTSVGSTVLLLMFHRSGFIRLWLLLVATGLILSACGAVAFLLLCSKVLTGAVLRNNEVVEQPVKLAGFTKRLVHEGKKFLEARHRDKTRFLLFMSWLQVHTSLHASSDFRGRSKHGAYGDEVEEMDWSVGAILSTLEALGMRENTLVYFSSDNGGHLEDRGVNGNQEGGWNGIYRGGKGQGGMDGGIRVPTVAMWPGKIPAGSVVDVPTSQMDVFATVAALLHLPLPADRIIDGVDIMPLLTGASRSPPHEFLFHYCGDQLHAARYTPQGNTGNVWKVYFMTPNWLQGKDQCQFLCGCQDGEVTVHQPPLLFNIGQDPSEMHQLNSLESPYAQIVQKVVQAVDEHKERVELVENQFSFAKVIHRPWLQPCCGQGPFPNCYCIDEEHAHVGE